MKFITNILMEVHKGMVKIDGVGRNKNNYHKKTRRKPPRAVEEMT